MENVITNFAIYRIQNVPSVEPNFLQKVDDQLSYCGIQNTEVKLWNLNVKFKSYGHWLITLELNVNGEKINLKKTTTDSQLIDRFKDEENAEAAMEVLMDVLLENETLLMQKFEEA
jgi:hypothetical protein